MTLLRKVVSSTMRILVLSVAGTGILSGSTLGQEASYTPAEYKAYEAAQKAGDPQQQISLLTQYEAKFPGSSLLPYVYSLEFQTYSRMKNYSQAVASMDKLLALGDKLDATTRLQAYFARAQAFNLGWTAKDASLTTPGQLAAAREAADAGLKAFASWQKPTNITDDAYAEHKQKASSLFHTVQGLGLQVSLSSQQQGSLDREETAGDVAAKAGDMRGAISHYSAAVQHLPDNPPKEIEARLREKVIETVLQLSPPPAVPQEAIEHAAYAQAALEEAGKDASVSHLDDAVKECQQALRLAPWWAQAYFNLGAVLQRANRPAEAVQALQFYLLADPHATNAQDVQMEIYKLKYEAKQ